jgi:hypothetical protein
MTPAVAVHAIDASGTLVQLLGVDPVRGVAVVWEQTKRKRPFVVETIDVHSGEVVDRWEASGVPSVDQERIAATVAGARYWLHDGVPSAQLVPGTAHVAYRDGEAVRISDERGVLTDLFEGSNLNQREHLAPDGERAAWVWFAGTTDRFSLVVAPIVPDPSRKSAVDVDGWAQSGPLWTVDGRSVLLTATDTAHACLYRADVEPLELWTVACFDGASGMSLAVAGDHAALLVHHGFATAEARWLALPDGTELARVDGLAVQGSHTEDLLVDEHGRLAMLEPGGHGLVAVDLTTGKRGRLDLVGLSGLRASDFVDDGVVIALCRTRDTVDVLRVDLRALIASDLSGR